MYPILFHVGSFPIHAWGVLLMIGFLVGTWRAAKVAPRYGIPGEDLWDAALFGLLGGIVGARLAYVAQNLGEFASHPGMIFALWQGGMTSFGGLIGGVAVGLWILQRRGHNLVDAGDLVAPSLALGYFFGRIGCYLNGCCYGGYCPEPLGVHFPGIAGTVHPTQLYSAAAGLFIFALLAAMEKRRQFGGQIIALFAVLYGVYRFIVEFFREGATTGASGIASLTTGQVASLVVSLLALAFYLYRLKASREPKSVQPLPGGDVVRLG